MLNTLKSLLSKALANDTVQRAVKTFIQAFVSTIVALVPVLQKGITPSIAFAAVTSAGAAGISAVWNSVVKPWLDAHKKDEAGAVQVPSFVWVILAVLAALFIWTVWISEHVK